AEQPLLELLTWPSAGRRLGLQLDEDKDAMQLILARVSRNARNCREQQETGDGRREMALRLQKCNACCSGREYTSEQKDGEWEWKWEWDAFNELQLMRSMRGNNFACFGK
ncbi:hypothetical protein AWZ03_015150, partial [Drosophila navojoa]